MSQAFDRRAFLATTATTATTAAAALATAAPAFSQPLTEDARLRTLLDQMFEVERYFSSPGQANSYKVGHTVWVKVWEDAKVKLGAKFDLKAFHNAVLLSGAMPLTVLERHVAEWAATQV